MPKNILITHSGEGNLSTVEEKIIHQLPVKMKYSGPANVDAYFDVKEKIIYQSALSTKDISDPVPIQKNEDEAVFYSAAFRGREVTGYKVDLEKHGFVGITLEGSSSIPTDNNQVVLDDSITCEVKGKFKEFTVWNKDNIGQSSNHVIRSIVEFGNISSAIHDE